MKNKILFVLALLVSICVQVNAQNWTWTGETPVAGGSYYLYNLGAANFLDMNNGAPVNAVGDPLLFTLTEGLDGTDLQYKQNGNAYHVYQSAGDYGYCVDRSGSAQSGPSAATMKSYGDSYRWKIKAYSDGYQIYSNHKYSSSWGTWAHRTDNDRYITYASPNYSCSKNKDEYNTNNGTFVFISEEEVKAMQDYLNAYKSASDCSSLDMSDNMKAELANVLSMNNSANFSTADRKIITLNAVKTRCEEDADKKDADKTALIPNPSFEGGISGWICNDIQAHIVANQVAYDGDFVELAGWGKTSASVEQAISNIPNGVYELSVMYQAASETTVALEANGVKAEVKGTWEGWKPLTTSIVVSDGNLSIKVSSSTSAGQNWANIDCLRLYKVRDFNLELNSTNFVENETMTGKYLFTTNTEGVSYAFGKGANWGTQAIPSQGAGMTLDIVVSNYMAQIKYDANDYLYDTGGYNLYTDNHIAGAFANQFYMQKEGNGYKFVLPNDPYYSIGIGIDGSYDVLKLVPTAEAPIWHVADDNASLSVKAGKFGTFVAPFDITLPENVTAYSVEVEGELAKFTELAGAGETLEAGNPVILKNDGDADVKQSFYGDGTNEESVAENGLVGFYVSGVQIPEGAYVMQTLDGEQAFYRVADASSFNGSKNRCYLPEPANGSSVKMLNIVFGGDDENTVESLSADNNGAIYDLQGRRVEKVQKGLYIRNGKVYVK